ncbi:retrovirus-related Pol polyprotein from transposon 412 [Trichonephila clavipes]|nr:retrovirus-related Pol polyprotein from transposon 412 [Trichonephila clavipes]
MPTTRAMEAQFQTLLEKLTASMNANMGEMKSELTGMNANMGEMKSELTASMNANMGEMKSDLTASMNANMGEMKSELTASMNANMTEMKSELTANKEELKSDLKGIGDKLTTMDKKFEEMEGRIESPSIKLSTYDGKSSWQVYKTQFSIVADANQWDSQTKACQLAASLRADAADILQTLPETQRLDFDALVNALELRFGEKCVKDYSRLQLKSRQQKVSETLQELATDVERLSHLAFSDCPTEVREVLALQHFIDGVQSRREEDPKCWTCGREGHLQRSCRARQGAETNSASQKGGVGKLINGHLVGRRLPDFGKPHFQVCQISTKSTDIADPFILGLDFLKEHGFTLDFNKNELRSIHEEVTIFKIEHRTESIRQVTANENITIPPRTEIIVPGYIGNDVSFNSGLIGTAENKANGLLIASTLVDLSEKLSRPVTCVCKSSSLLLSNSPQQLTPDLLENAELSPNRKAPQKDCSKNLKTCFLETVAILAIRQ